MSDVIANEAPVTAAPFVRFDAPAPHPVPAPVGGEVRAVAAALCSLLGDRRLADPPMRAWREGLRGAAKQLAAAGARGAIPTPEVARLAGVVRAAGAALDRRAALVRWTAELDPVLTDLAAADHTAGARLLALARGVLAETRDFATGSLPPTALLPAPPSSRTERGVAGAFLTAWAATHYRPLWGEAEAAVVAALARDAGELSGGRSGEPFAAHAARSAALLTVCDRLPAAAARIAARHHERPDGGGGPAGLAAADLTPTDRLLAWVDRFLIRLPAADERAAEAWATDERAAPHPAAAWAASWQTAAAASYVAARRGELCLTVTAAGLEALGLSRGDQGEANAAGVSPVGLALTDLGRTRLRLDAAHGLSAPRFAGMSFDVKNSQRDAAAVGSVAGAPE